MHKSSYIRRDLQRTSYWGISRFDVYVDESHHIWMSHVSYEYINGSCEICIFDMHILHISYAYFVLCDMTYSYFTFFLFFLFFYFSNTTYAQDLVLCDMTYSYFTWLVYMSHDSFICVKHKQVMSRKTRSPAYVLLRYFAPYCVHKWVTPHVNESCHV